ncbi:MAG: acetylxylan esterase [Pirellulaceae bacterium]|nr:acetylxylan esterase [Pirellulaceae bacterium]MDP7014309.1 acetylxylan esterase [Pirellulaceae bacterium]
MKYTALTLFFIALSYCSTATADDVPMSVSKTWDQFDPRAEPLETEVVRESLHHGIVLRHIRYVVGAFGGRKTRVAAFYAFPKDDKQLPGLVQIHGGGQWARPDAALYWASHGYAAIAVNWGEKVIDKEDDPNTDWDGIPAGFLAPSHHNDVTPGEGTLHKVPHPWNSSWLLYSAAARRAITFLERQPEVDGSSVGVTGHSMGGRLTVLTAIDPRVKAASPSVGGSGYLYTDITGVPGSARRMRADRELYRSTLDCRSYWPLIKCPVMFLGATNDFNSPMEKVIQGFNSLPQKNGAMSFTPHMNHRFTADNYAARVRWFETHLKGTFAFPKPARVRLGLKTDDGVPRFTVWPDLVSPHKLKSVRVYYGFDRDPRARFWRSAKVVREGDTFSAACPVVDLGEPMFVFANVTYDTGKPLKMPRGYNDTQELTVTSQCRRAFPHQLEEAGVKPNGRRERLIEDFAHRWRDWSLVSANNRHHWNFETHKINDPAFVGPRGASLAMDVTTTEPDNTLAVIIDVDRWRGYTGRKPRRYVALVKLAEAGRHSVSLPTNRFVTAEGEVLKNYDFATSLILTPGQKERPGKVAKPWQGEIPVFANIRWLGGEFAERPRPYLKLGVSEIDADAAFRKQFDADVKESVRREAQHRQ